MENPIEKKVQGLYSHNHMIFTYPHNHSYCHSVITLIYSRVNSTTVYCTLTQSGSVLGILHLLFYLVF